MTNAIGCAVLLFSTACATAGTWSPAAGGEEPRDQVPQAQSAIASANATTALQSKTLGQPGKDPAAEAELVRLLVQKSGEGQRARAERGVTQVAALWRAQDGDAAARRDFVLESFIADPAQLDQTLVHFEKALEQVDGHLLEVGRALRSWSELEVGPQLPIDQLFASLDLGAHLSDDFFDSKLAFVALLNFPLPDLQEMVARGPSWSRKQWQIARLTRRFALRPSGAAQQARAKAGADASAYIAGYNLWMHHVLAPNGARIFPKGVRLLTHWNLRDEIKADYALADKAEGLARQRLIHEVMARIVEQSIPQAVIDDPRLDWNPAKNQVSPSPEGEVEVEQMKSQGKRAVLAVASSDREPDTRYAVLLADYQAARKVDADSPAAPDEMARHFQFDDEIPEARVRALLEQLLSSPAVPRVAKIIEKRLGRPLEPQDVWYNGFLESRNQQPEEQLSAETRKRYPTAAAYKKDIPRLLQGLGFSGEKAKYLDEHIVVDPARGSGHALEADRRSELYPNWGPGDSAHLRTRINPDGMDYKGYNIAVHEMGHNVEQVFSLYEVDSTLLQGVPGTAFTEALAFTFQNRNLELLGMPRPDAHAGRLKTLNDFWESFEIAGVALTDLDVWHWMYQHPNATAAELRVATLAIARGYWDKYYAPVLHGKGSAQLAIYSHMIDSFLYLYRYPLGHLIAFQLEEKLKGPGSGAEFERVAAYGRVLPDLWMQHATGRPVVAEPLLDAATAAALAEER